jgi:hypothetical protein
MGRLNAFRLNVYENTTPVYINGAPLPGGAGVGLLIEGASIEHVLNDQVDRAQFTARGWTPSGGQYIEVYSGEKQADKQLFGGYILETTSRYLSKAAAPNVVTDIHCIDPAWLLTRTKVLGLYQGQSATAILHDIIARYTRWISPVGIQGGLPVIEAITFTNEDVPSCITQICQQVGAYWYVDFNRTLHVFTTADQAATPITQAAPGESGDHTITEDLSQVANRIIGLGGGVGAAVDLPINAPELPLDLGVTSAPQWYPNVNGALVQVGPQRASYAAIRGTSGRGSILGTGNAPTNAPTLAPASGSALGVGTYKWAITYKTAAGETFIGPAATAQTGVSAPTLNALSVRASHYDLKAGSQTPNANYMWRIAIFYSENNYSYGPATGFVNTGTKMAELYLGSLVTDPVTGFQYPDGLMSRCPYKIVQMQFYRSMPGGSTVYFFDVINGVAGGQFGGYLAIAGKFAEADLPLMGGYPTAPMLTTTAMTVTVPKSPSPSVTGRSLFRTAVNGSALRRLATIADNTTATYLDNNPDSALIAGAPGDPPASDTSLLREDGQINPGATSILVTDTTPFTDDGGASGGWALVGNLTVRYGGISGSQLTGIPASGSGSVTATVRYGAQVLVQPRLVGVIGLYLGARKGDTVTLRMEMEDQVAALAMANRIGSPAYQDGIIEFLVSDSRFGPTELAAHMWATLQERKEPRLTLTYHTRDITHDVGRLVTVTLDTPPINGTFRIQRVRFSEIAIAGALTVKPPKRTIEATNKLYTFADILRQLRGREAGIQ